MSNSQFRPLNENEKSVIWKAVEKERLQMGDPRHQLVSYARVSYEQMQGGFCVCVLVVPKSILSSEHGYLMYRGASRRSYKDPRNPIRGEMLAFSRTVLYSRAVEVS